MSNARPRDDGEREARERVLEEVFERAIVEEVLGLDVDPERAGDARPEAGVEDELAAEQGGVVEVARHRRGDAHLAVAFDAVAAAREAEEEAVRRPIRETVSVREPVAAAARVEKAVRRFGEEALRQIKAIRPDVPVILSSGYSEDEAAKRFTGKGLAGFLQKPYSAAELAKHVRTALAPS